MRAQARAGFAASERCARGRLGDDSAPFYFGSPPGFSENHLMRSSRSLPVLQPPAGATHAAQSGAAAVGAVPANGTGGRTRDGATGRGSAGRRAVPLAEVPSGQKLVTAPDAPPLAAPSPTQRELMQRAASSGRLVPMRQLHAAWLKEQLHASNDAADADGILSAFIMRKQSRRWQPGSKLQPAMRGVV